MRLYFVFSKFPLASIIDTRNFYKRGWGVNAGQYLKMVLQLNSLDLTNIVILRGQLTGVYAMYFGIFIDRVEEECFGDNAEFVLDTIYVCKLVEEIFR